MDRRTLLSSVPPLALGLAAHGCGPARRPRGGSVYVPVGQTCPGDAERVERALGAWDAQGWPALAVRVELRDPEPDASQSLGEPALALLGTAARAWTLPGATILCARGQERWIVHELLHVLHQVEGREPDSLHADPRWAAVDAVAAAL